MLLYPTKWDVMLVEVCSLVRNNSNFQMHIIVCTDVVHLTHLLTEGSSKIPSCSLRETCECITLIAILLSWSCSFSTNSKIA